MAEVLQVQRDGEVTRLILNRPDKANALNPALVDALAAALDACTRDGTRLAVFLGNGSNFCAGFDFSDFETASEGDLALRFIRIESLLQAVYHAPFATLALAHGRNFGAGTDLVAACGLRVATPGATFRMPGLRFGVVLGTRRLTHRIGQDPARVLLAESRNFTAEEALALNFVKRLAPPDEWDEMVEAAAETARLLDPTAASRLYALSVTDTRDADLAELARSVARPCLKERIRAFRGGG